MEKEIKIFSFFAGAGFLDLGFEKAGYDIEFVNEYFKPFLEAYQYSRNKLNIREPKYGYWLNDINDFFNNKKLQFLKIYNNAKRDGFVGFIGGPPCPDFSVGGKNKGKNGINGKLSLSYVNLIIENKPDFFLFENVKGLLKTKRHREYFEELKDILHKANYCTTEKLVNALEYGVPQDRERIILIGVLKKNLKKDYFNDSELLKFEWNNNIKYPIKKIKNCEWPVIDSYCENNSLPKPNNIIEFLTVEYWFKKNNVEHHSNSNDYFRPRSGLIKMQSISEGDVSKKSYKRLHRWRYSPTAAYGNNEVHLHPYHARRIAVSEALAIQSLPKEFELPQNMSLSNKFKTIGNGVPFLLAYGVAENLKEYLENI